LVMVYDLSNVLLDCVSKYFIEDFWVYFHQGYWPITFFFDVSLPGFGIRIILASQNIFDSILFFCTLWNNLRNIGVTSSLNAW
jgi:hypothetical protein